MLKRKLFRTMKQYKAQFISMIIMITLGIGIFVGFNIEWYSIDYNTSKFFEETGFADYHIISPSGFTKNDVNEINNIYGKDNVTRYNSIKVEVLNEGKSKSDTLSISTVENEKVSGFILNKGDNYENKEGIWLSFKYANTNNLKVGDTFKFLYNNKTIETKVLGLIQSSENMICVEDETQILPNYDIYGYAYISPKMFKKINKNEHYLQIHVKTDDSKSTFSNKVNKTLGVTSLITSKNESVSYVGSQGEIEEGKIMGSVLPVLFLLITTLTMVTTMYSITNKEKVLIGTLKAIGFKNKKILLHYISYAIVIGIVGTILGTIIGYFLAYMIINPSGAMGTYLDMPYWNLHMPSFGYIVIISIFILLILVCIYSVKNILKCSASEVLNSSSTKKVKPIKLEKTNWFYKKSFNFRWNLRDIIHNKARTLMSFIGVTGCTVILLASLGMRDTMNKYVDNYYNKSLNYHSKIYLTDNIKENQKDYLINKYEGDTSYSIGVKIEDKAVSLDIYNIKNNYIKFLTSKEKIIKIEDDGAYISKRIAKKYNLKKGDTFTISLYNQNKDFKLKVNDILTSITENIVISNKYADKLNIKYNVNTIYTNSKNIIKHDGIKTVQFKDDLVKSFDVMTEIMNMMIFMLVVVALILSIVVLYNLGVMGYTERYREMATLKVLGFKDKKISSLLISQNLWISILGIIVGIPLGYLSLKYLLDAMASEYEMTASISITSFIICIILNIVVSILVSIMVSKKNKNINMVEALKSVD